MIFNLLHSTKLGGLIHPTYLSYSKNKKTVSTIESFPVHPDNHMFKNEKFWLVLKPLTSSKPRAEGEFYFDLWTLTFINKSLSWLSKNW